MDIVTHDRGFYYIVQDEIVKQFLEPFGRNADRAAGFIQQLDYWLNNEKSGFFDEDGNKWIFRSYEDWLEKFCFLTKRIFGSIIRQLERLGIVYTTRYSDKKWKTEPLGCNPYNRTKFYRLNYKLVQNLLNSEKPEEWLKPAERPMIPKRDHQKEQNEPIERAQNVGSSIYKKTTKEQPNNGGIVVDSTIAFHTKENIGKEQNCTDNPIQDLVQEKTEVDLSIEQKCTNKDQTFPAAVVSQITEELQDNHVILKITSIPQLLWVLSPITNVSIKEASPPPKINKATEEQEDCLKTAERLLGHPLNNEFIKFLVGVKIEDFRRGLKILAEELNRPNCCIRNPGGFLRKAIIAKYQPEENTQANEYGRNQFSEEFLNWYLSTPKSENGLLDFPINSIQVNYKREPMVRLAPPIGRPFGDAPYELIDWREAKRLIEDELMEF